MNRQLQVSTFALGLMCWSGICAGGSEATEPLRTDYAVCQQCDLSNVEEPQIVEFVSMIASFRWDQNQSTTGLVEIDDSAGGLGTYQYFYSSGAVSEIKLISVERHSPGD